MRTLSLDFFNLPEDRKYHIHRIDSSLVAEEAHRHDFFQLCFVECGHIEHYLDDAPVLLNAGDAFLVPPGCAHRIVFPEKMCICILFPLTKRCSIPAFPSPAYPGF